MAIATSWRHARDIPSDGRPDSTLLLIRDGYRFVSNQRAQLGSDLFATRLLLRKAICIGGPESARLFYDTGLLRRGDVAPNRIIHTLLGKDGIHSLDGHAHLHRKGMFMKLMAPERLLEFRRVLLECWQKRLQVWQGWPQVVLFNEAQVILCQAICVWAGVPISDRAVRSRAADLTAMVDAFGGVGPRNWRGRLARHRSERWAGDLIDNVRAKRLAPFSQTALHTIAWHRDPAGRLLDRRVAAVELLNVLRPTMAVAYFIAFAAVALLRHPQFHERLRASSEYLELFVQEVRRFYPFTPFLGAITRRQFCWRGFRFPSETLVLLDVHGIDHDERIWHQPQLFDPERFKAWDRSAYNFVPQGGGCHHLGHRCAGEWLTLEALKVAVSLLVQGLDYTVPEQDLSFSLSRIPTYPKTGFVLEKVRARPNSALYDLSSMDQP
jgi:fatty-acid peroxygenase